MQKSDFFREGAMRGNMKAHETFGKQSWTEKGMQKPQSVVSGSARPPAPQPRPQTQKYIKS